VPKSVPNPIEQARHQMLQVVDALKRDAQLIVHEGKWLGMLTFPWSYGVVFTRITRKQFDAAGLASAIEPHRVICSDEMLEECEPEAFQSRLWDMFPQLMRGTLSLPQIDRVRWNLFPEVRVAEQGTLFAASPFDDADEAATSWWPSASPCRAMACPRLLVTVLNADMERHLLTLRDAIDEVRLQSGGDGA
jgi:hypothetical protein